jgi:predicted nucleic acid-binding Zn ribbon protein
LGSEYTYVCRECGRNTVLIAGHYNCKGWGDPLTRSEIMNGRYGKKAREVLRTHHGCNYFFQADVFQCVCGYTRSYDSLIIHGGDILDPDIYYFTRHQCPRCRKTIKVLGYFPDEISCTGCGSMMKRNDRSIIRW